MGWEGGITSINLKIARCQFHVLWQMLPYPRFSRFDKTDPKDISARVFSKMFDVWNYEIPINISPKRLCICSWTILSYLVDPKKNGFGGVVDMSTSSKHHKMTSFRLSGSETQKLLVPWESWYYYGVVGLSRCVKLTIKTNLQTLNNVLDILS